MNGAALGTHGLSYLLQFVGDGRDHPNPEVNVNAFRVIVQNKRKLKRNIQYINVNTVMYFFL